LGSVPVSRSHAGMVQRNAAAREVRLGTIYGFLAYASWGMLPLYFHALAPAQAFEILAHRIVWCLIFCLILVTLNRDTSWVPIILRHPRRLLLLTLAAFLLAVNWGVYIYAVTSGNVVESSLGYFINPLILVLMGVFILHERLRQLQWWAVGLGTIAVLVISFNYGRLPWIALTLACSFATYGFIKNRVGANIGALPSMTVETVVLVPFALAGIIWIERSGNGTFTSEGFGHTLMLLSTGIVTAVPLILFAAAARRVPLATMGLLQFFAPVLQFICGVSLLGEIVPLSRWIGFGLVWLALVVLTADTVRASRTCRRVSIQAAGNTA
jgi:chloramphenicol-sensitive protein RarD